MIISSTLVVFSMGKSGESLPWLEKEVFRELSESHSPSPESTLTISFSSLDFPERMVSSGMSSRDDKSRDLLESCICFGYNNGPHNNHILTFRLKNTKTLLFKREEHGAFVDLGTKSGHLERVG